jgi:3-dehydroquinate synthase
MKQEVVFTNDIEAVIERVCKASAYDKYFVLCDSNTYDCVLPRLLSPYIANAYVIVVGAGEEAKNIESLAHVWRELSANGATRHSLLFNIGGGMITDLGGMAAATFKRGIDFVNIPTTLLAAVDASVGGKTGINFAGLKNEVGVFAPAHWVVISTRFFDTLPQCEFLSGYAEMLKHGLIDGAKHYSDLLSYNVAAINAETLLPLLQYSVGIKQRIVEQDPQERGMRKILNLGHTVGHAIESHSHSHSCAVPHGYAVAWGLVCELLIAHRALSFPSAVIYDLAHFVEQNYGAYAITCEDYDELMAFMQHDKKNFNDKINFSLLSDVGVCAINNQIDRKEIEISLDFFRDLFHL